MAQADITLRITRLSMPALRQLGGNVVDKLRGNPAFPEPAVPLDELEKMVARFGGLISLATNGSRHALFLRNACAEELRTMLTSQAYYVRTVANGDAVLLATTGFPLRKTPQLIGALPAPGGIMARPGRAQGRIDVRWAPMKGSKAFEIFMAVKGSEEWTMVGITPRASFSVDGLESDRRYCFKVRALGSAGMSPESQTATALAA